MDERRQVQAEKNGYFGGELGSTRKGYDIDESDDDGIIYLSDEDEDDEEGGSCDRTDDSDENLLSDSKPAAAASKGWSGGSNTDALRNHSSDEEHDCIDLITPVKGLADMSLSDSTPSFKREANADNGGEEEREGERASLDDSTSSSSSSSQDGVIIDLTSP